VKNPADLPSRGCNLKELQEKEQFWLHGPAFLTKERSQWPIQPVAQIDTNKLNEFVTKNFDDVKPDVQSFFSQSIADQTASLKMIQTNHIYATQLNDKKESQYKFLDSLIERKSSWKTIVNTVARIHRLAKKARIPRKIRLQQAKNCMTTSFTLSEFQKAEIIILRRAQELHLTQEVLTLKKGQICKTNQLPKNSALQKLNVFWDEKLQIIRLKTRIHLAESLSESFKCPIIIPKSEISEKIILHTHKMRYHMSQKQTHFELRQRFWIIGGYNYVKNIVRSCKTPRCRYIKFESPRMSPLPPLRLDSPTCFTNVGVDYIGPLMCKHNCSDETSNIINSEKRYETLSTSQKKEMIKDLIKQCHHGHSGTTKVWLAIFTCFHSRAIHIELVESCSTLDFLDAFRRFVGHRGRPNVFYSDKATQFVAADKNLKELFKSIDFSQIQNHSLGGDTPIQWEFSTPYAPWTNGVTERMCKLVKNQLRIALNNESITIRTLRTLIIEIQSILNDRPLATITEDPDTLLTITSNMLLQGRHLGKLHTPTMEETKKLEFGNMWLKRKQVLSSFWSRWTKDYLEQLSVSKKWTNPTKTPLKEGDVVLLKNETLVKNVWQLARITHLGYNKDGILTKVHVKNNKGHTLEKTLRQIALLEPNMDLKTKVDLAEDGSQKLQDPLTACGSEQRGGQPEADQLRVDDLPPDEKSLTDDTEIAVNAEPIVADTVEVDAQKAPSQNKKKRKRHPRGHYKKLDEGKQSQ
jgi:hypothetical protein